ncbi:MAG TPA: hypothetical protein PL009_01475 [Flavipsychrobacter sp.]|nr:hypothetical protein [Flavipsychrobacter sp.]
MELDNHDWKTINTAIDNWQSQGKLSDEKAEELRSSVQLKKTNQQIAHYFFLIALSCTLMAFGAIFIDEKLLERIKEYFSLSNIFIAILMASLAAGWFYYIRKKSSEIKNVAYEIYIVLGSLAAITSLVYLCKDVGFGKSYTLFLFLSVILLGGLSIAFNSKALWIGTLAAAMGWYGSFAYAYSSDHLFLGMNYPLRYTIFGLLVVGFSFVQAKIPKIANKQRITYIAGLVIFFTGLWGVSVFGNYNEWEEWMKVRQTQVMFYGVIFGIASMIALYLGIRYKDDIARDLGILFLLINFYSRYFEYFWDTMHKGIFFLFLAVSFWFIGRYIEKKRKKETKV